MVQSSGNYIPTFSAAQGAICYKADASASSFITSLASISAITDGQLIQVKDLTISIPKEEAEKVDLLGTETTTSGTGILSTGQWQNQFHDIKSVTDAEISGTMILTLASSGTNGFVKDMMDIVAGSGSAVAATHTRFTFGDVASGHAKTFIGAIFVLFDNGASAGVVGMLNPVVNFNEITVTGTDGHYELSFTAKALARNFAIELEKL